MLVSLVAGLVLAQDQQNQITVPEDTSLFREKTLASVDKGLTLLLLRANVSRLETPKKSPLHEWPFEYISYGMTREREDENYNLRIRVYNQYRKSEGDPTDDVLQMLMRLWDFNRWRLNSDHNERTHMRTVDVYLCAGGEPGAEQMVIVDPFMGDPREIPPRANNIYIYSITTLEDKLEFAREIAHEYGHATWPAFGEFSQPEKWASGDMAERVFMMWLLQELQAKRLGPGDMMNVPLQKMIDFYDYRIRPDLRRVGLKGPNFERLAKTDAEGYTELLGLCSYAAAIMPHRVFGDSLFLASKPTALAFHEGLIESAERVPSWKVTVPRSLENDAIWVPLRKGRVTGANTLQRKGNWVKIQPTSKNVTVINETSG